MRRKKMYENLEEQAFNLLSVFTRITPRLLMRKFQITGIMATKLCNKIALRQHLEIRKFLKEKESH
jgi:hypothetical protein